MKRLFLCLVVLMVGMNLQAQNSNLSEVVQYYKDGNATALKKEAQAGNVQAMSYLSKLYDQGRGVTKNPSEALYWLEKAAEIEDFYIETVAYRYYNGIGVAKNLTEAFRWWKKGAEAANPDDILNLAECYYRGEGTAKSVADAMYWWMKIIIMFGGDDDEEALEYIQEASWNIAECFWKGDGVEHNKTEAVKWWKRAAYAGHEPSQKALKEHNVIW